MTISNAHIVSCPFCRTQKELMSLGSSNNIGAQYWSDLKTIAPMDPKISPVQKCEKCGKYYLEYKQDYVKGEKESWETGKLSYLEWKEAYLQFCTELGNNISQKDMLNVQGWLLQAYNDYFYRNKALVHPSAEEQSFIKKIINTLIETIEWGDTLDEIFPGGVFLGPPERERQVWSSKLNPIIKAELYREIGEFKKCDELLKSFNGKRMHSFDDDLCYCINEQMKKDETAVFKFYDEREHEADNCTKQEEQSEQGNRKVDAYPTMLKCPNCGNYTTGPKCTYCGAELFKTAGTEEHGKQQKSAQWNKRFKQCPNGHYYSEKLDSCPYCNNMRTLEPDMDPQKHTPQNYNFKQCPNGHYYSVNLERCPYCGSMAPTAKPFHQEEPWCFPTEYIIDEEGHYFMLNSDGKTASFICWSKEAWDIYHKYKQFYDWYIEVSLDDAQEVKRQEVYFDTVRIKSYSASFYIPREIVYNNRTYPVVRIMSGAFAFCEISSITIPDTIIHIEKDAFFRCDDLDNLFIPGSVIYLANKSISQCKDLKTITWHGTTYEDDIDEPFLFPDHKDKYAIKLNYNDNIDPECKEWFPWFCALGGPYSERQKESSYIFEVLHRQRDIAINQKDVEDSYWYRMMRLYIDEYTMKIIERNQCYKYGLSELDDHQDIQKHHIFWKLKKAIIKQDYGLNWLTPEEQFVAVRQECFHRT